MGPGAKRAAVIGGLALVGVGVLALVARKASAAPGPNPGPGPNLPPQVGKLDANTALACCSGSWSSKVPPGEVFDLLTPNSQLPGSTVYAFFKDELWKWEAANQAGYFYCTSVNVARLRSVSGYSP